MSTATAIPDGLSPRTPFIDVIIGSGPYVIVAILCAGAGKSVFEPEMFRGAMVCNQVDNDLNPVGVGFPDKGLKFFHGTILRVSCPVIGNIISMVAGGRINRH